MHHSEEKRMLVAVAKANFPESKNLRKVSKRRSADELKATPTFTLEDLCPHLHLLERSLCQASNDRVGDIANTTLQGQQGLG